MAVPSLSAETPIEEFTPTPAFPALQYLESVDVEGVAWRAGLRTGDFLIEVSFILPFTADGANDHLEDETTSALCSPLANLPKRLSLSLCLLPPCLR